MEALTLLALAGAAFVAGAVNAVAGGGSLISFPALLAAGFDPRPANVTNTVALWPGYLSGSWGYRNELQVQRWRTALLSIPSMAGALAGSAILLVTPGSAFSAVVPYLIIFACVVMAVQERLADLALRHRLVSTGERHIPAVLHVISFVLAAYGAYFGAGLGILLFAALGIFIPDDAQHTNALKGLLSAVINGVAFFSFAGFGPVQWPEAVVMGAGAIAGGYLGVGVARRLGQRWLRIAVIGLGLAVAGVLLAR